jgi:hypothetical protein
MDAVIKLNTFQTSYRKAIELSKVAGIVWLLQTVFKMDKYERKQAHLRSYPNGSVGKTVANVLDEHGLRLIPKFESHDLKHVLLGYEMTPEDEVKMQAFMLGNGNYTIPCFLFLSLGLLMPEIWKELVTEYRRGQKIKSIKYLTLDNCAGCDLAELKRVYGLM